jgi:hypothetical protein
MYNAQIEQKQTTKYLWNIIDGDADALYFTESQSTTALFFSFCLKISLLFVTIGRINPNLPKCLKKKIGRT